jgi:putative transposase
MRSKDGATMGNRLWDDALRSSSRSVGEIPRVQRRHAASLAQWLQTCASREAALYRAHTESGLTMSALAEELGLSVSRVSRLIAGFEMGSANEPAIRGVSRP